jgi:hypothetical protein
VGWPLGQLPVGQPLAPDATIEEVAMAVSCPAALVGVGYQEAAQTLRVMVETARSLYRFVTPVIFLLAVSSF